MRGVVIVGLLIVGWFTVTRSLASVVGPVQPEWALAIAPGDSAALSAEINQALGDFARPAAHAQAVALAKRAIARDPTNVNAVVALALDAETRGKMDEEARLFAYSNRLSRRDLRTRIYFVENAVARGDVVGALHQYDIALRTSFAAYDLMFPVLAGAISDARLRLALADLLAAKVPWGSAFLSNLASAAHNDRASLLLLADLRARHATFPPDIANVILTNVTTTDPALAYRYYQTLHPGVDLVQPVNGGFDRLDTDGSPFDWQLSSDNGISVSLQRVDRKGVLSFSVPATAAGVLARQLRVLPPGTYLLQTEAMQVAQPKESQPYWQMMCSDGRDLGHVDIGNAGDNGARYSGTIVVPADCKAGWLQLVARATDGIAGVSGAIDGVTLRRVSSSGKAQ